MKIPNVNYISVSAVKDVFSILLGFYFINKSAFFVAFSSKTTFNGPRNQLVVYQHNNREHTSDITTISFFNFQTPVEF